MKTVNGLIKSVCLILAVSLFALCFAACGDNDTSNVYGNSSRSKASGTSESDTVADTTVDIPDGQTPYAVIDIKDYGKITAKLDPSAAPITVSNFISLAESEFYNGLTFHRIMDGFMMQGGDPKGDGSGGSEKNIKGEFSQNGVTNKLSHTRGAIAMARASYSMDSASSQFFIVQTDATYLDGQYACFGYVTEGMDIVDKVCADAKPTDNNGTIPKSQQPVINSITIEYK